MVLWRFRYKLSLRGLAEMSLRRSLVFTHETVREWECKLAPPLGEILRKRRHGDVGQSWHEDETYVKVRGQWSYLYRASDRDGNLAVSRADDLGEWSRLRWQVDTSLAQLKTTMRMEIWHGQTVPGVLKELTVFAIVDNLVRPVMCQSSTPQHIGVERISVVDALRWLGAPSTGIS